MFSISPSSKILVIAWVDHETFLITSPPKA